MFRAIRCDNRVVLSLLGAIRKNWLAAVIALGAALLLALGGLQYWWTGQISEFQASVLQTSLESSARQFEREVEREAGLLLTLMQPAIRPGRRADWTLLRERRAIWEQASSYPGFLMRTLVHIKDENGQWSFSEVGEFGSQLQPVPTDHDLARVEAELEPFREMPRNARSLRPPSWLLIPESGVLAKAVLAPIRFGRRASDRPAVGWSMAGFVVLVVDWNYLRNVAMPTILDRQFADEDGSRLYDVAIAWEQEPRIVYRTDDSIDNSWFERADLRRRLQVSARTSGAELRSAGQAAGIDPRRRFGSDRQVSVAGTDGPVRAGARAVPGARLRMVAGGEMVPIFLEVAAAHVEGSVAEVVERQRMRELAAGFAVLLLLAGATMLVVVSARRAARLADMQMEFIAGVTHELRTPLSVIFSAAENLADGVVRTPDGARRYGTMVLQQARRLREMVERTLQFAALESGGRRLSLARVALGPALHRAVSEVRPVAEQAGFALEHRNSPNLPDVRADEEALQQILANLLSNAVKYGEPGRWVGVDTETLTTSGRNEVRIHVRDRGPGIAKGEESRLFDAYYRGPASHSGIHGTGLGLKLARDLAVQMGGQLSVKSELGRGSVFTLHLPAMAAARS